MQSYWYGVDRDKCDEYDDDNNDKKYPYQRWGKRMRRRDVIVIVSGVVRPLRRR